MLSETRKLRALYSSNEKVTRIVQILKPSDFEHTSTSAFPLWTRQILRDQLIQKNKNTLQTKMCEVHNVQKITKIRKAHQTLENNGINPENLAWAPRKVLSDYSLRISFVGGQLLTVRGLGTYATQQKN